jgi:SAM-dependent methyltransferase
MTLSRWIIEIDPWLETPYGRCVREWEQAQLDRIVADLFGFHALQVGWPAVQGLRANRMPHRWLLERSAAGEGTTGGPGSVLPLSTGVLPLSVLADFEALPFPSQSLDLVVLPHTLERAQDAHHTLREVERVLMPEGRVVVIGFNPASLLGMQHRAAPLLQRLGRGDTRLPVAGELIGWRRLRDWIRLLGFEIESGQFGCYRPPFASARLLDRSVWVEDTGARWWPVLGSVYVLQAVKRVRGMRLIGPAWKRRRQASSASTVVAQRQSSDGPSVS